VIGVTESWATSEILHSKLHINGYEVFRRDRATPNRGGGVLLYVKSTLQPIEHTVRSDFGDSVWCKMGTLLIGVCYRSNNSSIVGTDNDAKLCELVMGDFNFPEISWNSNTVSASGNTGSVKFFESVEDSFLSQHVQFPTRGYSVLDLVLTRDPDLVSNVQVTSDLGCSDHSMIAFSIHHTGHHINYVVRRFDYQKGNYNGIKSTLEDTDWDEFMSVDTVSRWHKFKE